MPKKNYNIKDVIYMLRGAYEIAKTQKWIHKPMSYALYEVWKIVDALEKEVAE